MDTEAQRPAHPSQENQFRYKNNMTRTDTVDQIICSKKTIFYQELCFVGVFKRQNNRSTDTEAQDPHPPK